MAATRSFTAQTYAPEYEEGPANKRRFCRLRQRAGKSPEMSWHTRETQGRPGTATSKPVLRAHITGCRWFWAWALLGCAAALGFVSLGVLLLAPVAVVGGLMASRPTIRRSAFGLLSGAGVLLLYVAWVQRAGPGTTCWQTGTASGCDQHLNPLPWLLLGIAMFIGGIVAHARRA